MNSPIPRRTFLKRAVAGAAVLGSGSAAYGYCERHWLDVEEVPVTLGLPHPMRIAALGDLHFDPWYNDDYLRQVIQTVNELKVDLVCFTGDFVTSSIERLPQLCEILGQAMAAHGSYGVLGNHDCRHMEEITGALEEAGIRMMTNRSEPLPGQPGWFLTGVLSLAKGNQNISALTDSAPDSKHIFLAHEPETFDIVDDPRAALQISGHTHGGQIRMPLIGALLLPKWGKNYDMGLFRKQNGRQLYVNRGIGTIGPSVRINCRPEVTLLELS